MKYWIRCIARIKSHMYSYEIKCFSNSYVYKSIVRVTKHIYKLHKHKGIESKYVQKFISAYNNTFYHMNFPFIKPFHKFSNMTHVAEHFLLQFRAPWPVTS